MTQGTDSRQNSKSLRAIGLRIRTQREKRGLSQEQLAELAGLHDRTIGKIERGQLNFSVLILGRLCKALDHSPNRLLDV